jgi:uncharacterized protein
VRVAVVLLDAGNELYALSAAIDTVVVLGAVVWAARGEPFGRRLLYALAIALALLAVKGLVMLSLDLDALGVAHVVWLDLVVVAPLAGLAVVALAWRRAGTALRVGAVAACLMAPLGAYASFVEPSMLRVERTDVPLPSGRAGDRPLKVAVIADLQFERLGGHERDAVERAMEERPDVILLAGDYHQGDGDSFEGQLPEIRDLLRRLDAPGGVFSVQGDAEGFEEYARTMAGTGIRPLLNEVARTRVGDRRVTIAGLERDYDSPAALTATRRLERARGARDVRILLAHRPDAVFNLAPDTRVDLTVAGHTHGGQLQVPLFGPLWISSEVPRDVGAGGLHSVDGRRIYVSRGVGVERGDAPRFRLNAPPELAILTLR